MSKITYEISIKGTGRTHQDAIQDLFDKIDAIGGTMPNKIGVSENHKRNNWQYSPSFESGYIGFIAYGTTIAQTEIEMPESLDPF